MNVFNKNLQKIKVIWEWERNKRDTMTAPLTNIHMYRPSLLFYAAPAAKDKAEQPILPRWTQVQFILLVTTASIQNISHLYLTLLDSEPMEIMCEKLTPWINTSQTEILLPIITVCLKQWYVREFLKHFSSPMYWLLYCSTVVWRSCHPPFFTWYWRC